MASTAPNEDALRPAEQAKSVEALTKIRRRVLWPEIKKRNPHVLNPECENILRRQCHHEFAQLRLPEQRARLEKHAGRGQPFARQDQHVDSRTSSGVVFS